MEAFQWPAILLLLAITLIALEIFVPSGGALSVMAAIAVVASVVVGFSKGVMTGAIVLLVDVVVIPILIGAAIKWWPHTPLGKLVLIKRPESEDDVLPDTEEYHRDEMIGKRGVAKTELLPSGDVLIEGRVYDSVSNGVAISTGQAVKVVAVDTQRLVVRPLGEKELAAETQSDGEDILSTPIDSLGIEPFDDPLA